jgi:HEPN domain-containing protein
LIRLVKECGLDLDDEESDFLIELSAYYINIRYPEDMDTAAPNVDNEKAKDMLRSSQEIMVWLESMLT